MVIYQEDVKEDDKPGGNKSCKLIRTIIRERMVNEKTRHKTIEDTENPLAPHKIFKWKNTTSNGGKLITKNKRVMTWDA